MLFAKLWDVDMKKKIERENKEKAEKQERVKETMDIINWQNKSKAQQDSIMKEKEAQEKAMLNDLWKIEDEKEREMERQKLLLNKERYLELIRHNQMEKEIKDMEESKEKQRDKMLLQMALDRENALRNLEVQEKDERRRDAKELQEHYKQQNDAQAREEAMIEYQLTQVEEEKQRKIQDEKWRKEDEARIQLLREVYESRAQNIENKKMFKKEANNNILREKDELDIALQAQNIEHESKVLQQKMNKSKHQGDVLKQVGEKERGKRKEYQETMFEQRAMKLAELDYTRKIGDEQMRNTQLLNQLRSQRPY